MTCMQCADLQIAVETLASAGEQLAEGKADKAADSVRVARYWLK